MYARFGKVKLGFGYQRRNCRLLVSHTQPIGKLTLQVFTDVCAQALNCGLCNVKGSGQRAIELWQMCRLNFFNSEHEVSRFSGHIFAVVVSRKAELEGLALA